MCMVDFDDIALILSEHDRIARKEHKCMECWRVIRKGERYHIINLIFDREFKSHKTCAHCYVMCQWLSAECGGFMFRHVREDITEHVQYAYSGWALARCAIGMRLKWTKKNGELMKVPELTKLREGKNG
jgi:hypothetical protein